MLKRLRRLKNRGQSLVLDAVLVPLMILFVGAGLDLGWYYLNVSRMQNASDAAVMAGAWKFLEDEGTLSDYSDALLIDFVPSYILRDPDTKEAVISTRDKTSGDIEAKAYVKKNLAPNGTWNDNTIVDSYENANNLTLKSQLYGRAQDISDYGYYSMWYRVVLEEDVKHFFLPGWFPAMNAKVQSVAKITHYISGPNLFEQTKAIAERQTYAGWDFIKATKNSNTEADARSVLSTGNKYRVGDKHRMELLRLNGIGGVNQTPTDATDKMGNPYTSYGKTDQTGYDDLFIDWQYDMKAMDTDTDIGNGVKSDKLTYSHFLTDTGKSTLTGNENLQRRIHGTINFEPNAEGNFPYPVRDTREPPDPLYARIESEPVHDGSGLDADGHGGYIRKKGGNGSSVRQIIINLNVPNTTKYTSGKYAGEYSDRPIFFYYTGPEKNLSGSAEVVDYYDGYNEASHVRDSLPVIINFNADFRGIFFFPNSPVVINGNQNNFEGYVIAKEFVMLKQYKDGEFVHDEKNDVYYDISTKTTAPKKIQDDPEFTKITYTQNGRTVTKYISNSDLAKYGITEVTAYNSAYYSKDELGDAEKLAYESGNGKVSYYYTLSTMQNSNWTSEQLLEKTNSLDWIKKGEGYFNRKDTSVFKVFANGWKYNNSGTANAQGVWRAKEILSNGSDGEWLDAIAGDTKNKFLLKVTNANKPANFYDTAAELLTALGGYTQINDTTWKKNDATPYMKINAKGNTYYIPTSGVSLYDGTDPSTSAGDKVAIKYYEDGTEQSGYADISGNPEKYYLLCQDDIYGNDTTLNPMFVDELGNVQYRKNDDGSYKTVTSTIAPTSDTALMNRAIETAVKELIADLPESETEGLDTLEKKIDYLKQKDAESYNNKVNNYFYEDFNYLVDGGIKFFDKDDFNLATSVFDSFELVKMTQYSYLNMKGDQRSINNLFTNSDAIRTD